MPQLSRGVSEVNSLIQGAGLSGSSSAKPFGAVRQRLHGWQVRPREWAPPFARHKVVKLHALGEVKSFGRNWLEVYDRLEAMKHQPR